jgi:hypothetical protein
MHSRGQPSGWVRDGRGLPHRSPGTQAGDRVLGGLSLLGELQELSVLQRGFRAAAHAFQRNAFEEHDARVTRQLPVIAVQVLKGAGRIAQARDSTPESLCACAS